MSPGLPPSSQGLDTWFFLTADYAFGQDLEKDTTNVVVKSGGKVLGSVRHPLNTSDFSSFLLQAQASKAKVIGLANAGGDTINAIKQAAEFGLMKGGQKVVAAARLHHRYRQHRAGDRAGPAAGRSVLLGPQRRHARVFKALHGADQADADVGAGRRLFLGARIISRR